MAYLLTPAKRLKLLKKNKTEMDVETCVGNIEIMALDRRDKCIIVKSLIVFISDS